MFSLHDNKLSDSDCFFRLWRLPSVTMSSRSTGGGGWGGEQPRGVLTLRTTFWSTSAQMKWLKTNWTMRKTSSVQTIHSSMVTRSSRSTREWRGLIEYWLERQLSCLPLSNLASNLVAYYDSLDHRQKIVRTNRDCAKNRDNLSVWEKKQGRAAGRCLGLWQPLILYLFLHLLLLLLLHLLPLLLLLLLRHLLLLLLLLILSPPLQPELPAAVTSAHVGLRVQRLRGFCDWKTFQVFLMCHINNVDFCEAQSN